MEPQPMTVGMVVLACALLLGGGMQVAEPLLGLPNSVSALGAPWLVCAFAVGALTAIHARRAARGAVAAGRETAALSTSSAGHEWSAAPGRRAARRIRGVAAGWRASGRVRGAAAGAALLVSGTGLYYAALVYGYGPSELRYALTMTLAWGVVAAAAGGVMGALGALWSRATGRRAVLLGALPAAVLAGEALLLRLSWGRAAFALAAELLLAAVLLGLLTWRRASLRAAVVTAALLAVAFAGAEAELRVIMRAAGWHGA